MSSPANRANGKYREKYGPLLDRCQSRVLSRISDLMIGMYANAEPTLHGWADQTFGDMEKKPFYRASTFLQIKEAAIDKHFEKALSQGFVDFWGSSGDAFHADYTLDSSLMLIGDDSMEETVIISNIKREANDRLGKQLHGLKQRLGAIRGGANLDLDQIPGGPDQLVAAFSYSLTEVECDVDRKKAIFRLFDQFVMRNLAETYDQYNSLFVEAGVLPNLSAEIRNLDSLRASIVSTASSEELDTVSELIPPSDLAPEPAVDDADELETEPSFNGLFNLMNQSIGSTMETSSGDAPNETSRSLDAALKAHQQANTISTQELVKALDRVAKQEQSPPKAGADVGDIFQLAEPEFQDPYLQRINLTLKVERRRLYQLIPKERIQAADAAAIELTGNLFQHILEQPLLPDMVKSQLVNLHIPYLKVAIIDRELFTDANHIGRRLLDQMMMAGENWVNEEDLSQGIYPDLQKIVDYILRKFDGDMRLLEKMLAFLSQRIEHFERGSKAIEKRTRNNARGRERLDIARGQALKEIEQYTSTPLLHPDVIGFLKQVWTDRLIFILLQNPDKREWRESLALMEVLVMLFDPRHRTAITDNDIREIREGLESGLAKLGDRAREKNHPLFSLLTTPETVSAAVQSAIDRPSPITVDRDSSTSMLLGRPKPSSKEEKLLLDRIRDSGVGAWFLFQDSNSGAGKGRLSWISPITYKAIFVDGSGELVQEKPLQILAKEIMVGKTRMFDPERTPFFSRTLGKIQHQLR